MGRSRLPGESQARPVPDAVQSKPSVSGEALARRCPSIMRVRVDAVMLRVNNLLIT